ncbi:MAG: M56 family metallopeptidase [Bacteroidia bacterium]|nr:M56 family metallopeptidase [Bacteroidia bacterium]
MTDIFLYLLKVTACTAAFYFIYFAFLKNETFFKLNRFYLIFTVVSSFILPLFHFSNQTIKLPSTFSETLNTVNVFSNQSLVSNYSLNMLSIILFLYIGITSFFLFRYLFRIIILASNFINKSEIISGGDYKLIKTNKDIPPCSFFNYIIIPNRLIDSSDLPKILTHENVHVKQMHSVDNLLIELITALLWFNPFVWKIKTAIKNTHEYLADEGVVEQGFDTTGYRLLLLEHAVGFKLGLANNLNQSITLKRMLMLNKSKSNWAAKLKVLSVIPVLFLLIGVFSCESEMKNPENIVKDALSSDQSTEANEINATDSVFNEVENAPEFPGGTNELMNFIATNVKYPQVAKENGITGKVFVQFVVSKDGSVKDVKIAKGVDKFLDEEAMRVIKSLPDWTPGKNRGVAVNVQFTIPINFQLN